MPIFRTPYFSPLNVSGCVLWLDGKDPGGTRVIPSTGATVSTWVDKSVSAKHGASTGTPTYVAGGGINFDGSSYFLNQTFSQNLSQRSIFIVFQETSHSEYAGVFPLIPTPNSGNDQSSTNGLSSETANNTLLFQGNFPGYQSQIGNANPLPKAIYHDSMNGTVGSGYFNGTNATNVTASYTAGTCSGYGLGGRWQGGSMSGLYRLNGVIFEILFFNRLLGTAERRQIEGYLAQKWSLTGSLPAGHPGLGTTINNIVQLSRLPYYRVFDPRAISSLVLWLDAADSTTVSGTSPITAWTDKSSAGRTVTITSGPTYGTTTRNGLKTMSFNNNVISSSIASAVGTGDFTLIAVWYQSSAGTNTVLSLGTVASSSQSLGYSGNKYNFYQYGSLESAYTTGPGWVVQVGTRISSIKRVYITGTIGSVPASDSFNVTNTTVTIGKGDNFAITGEIAEIMVYTGTMSDTNRQLLEGYLAQKWGLTGSLVAGHPSLTVPVGAPATGVGKQTISFLSRAPPVYGSVQLSGANYLSTAGNAGTAMGTGDFTWECFVYPTSSTGYQAFIDSRLNPLSGGDTTGFYFGTNYGTLTPMFYTNGLQLASSVNITLNAWNHVALTRASGTVRLWVNGASGGTKSDTTNLTNQRVFIGSGGAGLYLTGNIANLRIVKGTAVYTGTFSRPTTAVQAISGTQLLLNFATTETLLTDSSTNNFTVTNTGTATWNALTPF